MVGILALFLSSVLPAAHAADTPVYLDAGITLGTPGILNQVVGVWGGHFGARLSGMYLGDTWAGAQVAPSWRFGGSRTWHHVGVAVGTFRSADYGEFTYAGPVYELQTRGGFFFEGGLTVGTGDFTNPQLILQIGFVHRIPVNGAAREEWGAERRE